MESRRTPRLYADTSVFGGCFDAEFDRPSRVFFDQVRGGRLGLVVSSLVKDEVVKAPAQVQSLFAEMEAFAPRSRSRRKRWRCTRHSWRRGS